MDLREIRIMEVLEEERNLSQREIANKSGLSLGLVNMLIKSLVKNGLIKIEKLNYRNVKYILTPKGINEKSKKTISYLKSSYKIITSLMTRIKGILPDLEENKIIYLYGEKDEIYQIAKMALKEEKLNYKYLNSLEKIEEENFFVFVWEEEFEKNILKNNLEYINIIK